MPDPRFFTVAGPFTVSRLAEISEAKVGAGSDPDRLLRGVAPLEAAGPDDVTFLDNRRYVGAFTATRAGACVLQSEMADKAPSGMALLLTEEPYRAYARIAQAFHPTLAPEPWISAAATVDPSARVAPGCRIEAGAVIGARAEIGARTSIGANAVIGPGVVLGEDCAIGAGATISHSLIGRRVTVFPGARLGQDGFGFAMGPAGHLKVPQLGRVIVEDDVEIGANTTVDRGAGPDTVIGAGTKIDNLVQIGHNVQIGPGSILVAQVGISGSTKLGPFVAIGGQAGLTGHLQIGAGARIAAQSGVMRDIEPGGTVGGAPAVAIKEFWRQCAALGGSPGAGRSEVRAAMAVTIHATAVVEPGAKLGEGVAIGPYCVVGPDVVLGDGVALVSHVVVAGHTEIGAATRIFPFASIGHQPQDLKYRGEPSRLIIGRDNTIRESVTMNPGTEGGNMVTRIGDSGLFMTGTHVAHDCTIGDGVIMANNATLAGHVAIGDHAVLGGLCAVHQFVRIGTLAMVGGLSGVEFDVIPYGSVIGNRAWLAGLNLVGLRRRGVARDDIHTLRRAYQELFAPDGTMTERVERVAEQYRDSPQVAEVVAFMRAKSQRGICQAKLEDAGAS